LIDDGKVLALLRKAEHLAEATPGKWARQGSQGRYA
jgi:hypothetical protein